MNRKDLNYSFTPVPTTFMYLMDSDCYKAMALLMHYESYWKSNGKLVNGFFTKSIGEIKDCLLMANEKDARLTIEALFRSKLIDVYATDGRRSPLRIRLNWDKIMELANKSIKEIQEFETPIVKLKRNENLTYCQQKVEDMNGIDDNLSTNCTPTLYRLENTEIIEKEKDKKESLSSSSSLSSFSSSLSSEEQVQESFNPDDNQEDSTQETEDEEDEEWFDEVTEYIRTNAFRELRGETITKEDENFQKSIRMLMEYDNFSRKEAIEVYNEILHRFKDSFRKLPSLWRKTEQSIAD